MLRAIIFFAVFTITAATPTPVQEAPNDFYDARNGVDKDPLLHVRNKNNEIMENWPLNGYVNFVTNGGSENVDNVFEEKTEKNANSVEKNPFKILHHSTDHDADIKDNLVDTDDEKSSNFKESVFITLLVEFVKSIAEQIMAAYKS